MKLTFGQFGHVILDPPGRYSDKTVVESTATLRLRLDYPLDHGMLPADACLGLGNHVAAPGPATIDVHDGVVAVLVAADEPFASRSSSREGA